MQNSNRIKVSIVFQISYEIIIIILPFILSPYISRVLGAERLGVFSYTYSIAQYFSLFSMLGIRIYGNRAIAQVRNDRKKLDKTFSGIYFLHLLISIVVSICFYMSVLIWNTQYKQYLLIQGLIILSSILDISWFYFGMERFYINLICNLTFKIASAILVLTLVKEPLDLWKYCSIMTVGVLGSQLFSWIPIRKYVSIKKVEFKEVVGHFKPMLLLFIPTIAISLYKYMDKIMIGAMSSTEQLGYYHNAEQIIAVPIAIIGALGTVMLPRLSNLIAIGDRNTANKYTDISMKYINILALGMAGGIAACGTTFSVWFWGKDFLECGRLIQGLSFTIPFVTFANIIRTQYLIPQGKDKEYIISVFGGAAINLIINYCLIPKYGANGAMIGTIAAECTVCIIQSIISAQQIRILFYCKQLVPFLASSLLMHKVVNHIGQMLPTGFATILVQCLSGVIIYCVCTFGILLITKDEKLKLILGR